jgi:hypothetical protein
VRDTQRSEIFCSQFECTKREFLLMYERAHRFPWVLAEFRANDGSVGRARMCAENTDENYLLNKCVTQTEYWNRGRFYSGKIWRGDILPFPSYLKHCLKAPRGHGSEVLDNFLDASFLADGITSIRKYISETRDWAIGATDIYSYED